MDMGASLVRVERHGYGYGDVYGCALDMHLTTCLLQVARLVEMGFPADSVRHALQVNNQDEEAALNSLLSGGVDSVVISGGAGASAPAPGAPAPGGAAAAPAAPKKGSSGMFGMWGKK
ncbi:hypothetical protein EON64_06230 [archaeon]|nr:MAG: hypothetical protein EON64_06230 [archaeon]